MPGILGQNIEIHVDSVAGSDTNNGTTPALSVQTLTKAATLLTAGHKLGLARGSYWREQFNIPAENINIAIYGTGAMPVIDGADVVVGTWTQPDAGTYPDVWSIAWSRAIIGTVNEPLGLWLNGVRPALQTTLANLQANGGWHTTSLMAVNSTVSIKSATDPNSSGDLYEIGKRQFAFNGHSTTLLATRTAIYLGPIEVKRCLGHYNAGSFGLGSAAKVLLRDGTIHHSVTEATSTEDSIATEYSPQIINALCTAYRSVGTGFAHTFRRCMALLPGAASRLTNGASGFYAHGSSPSTIQKLTVEACLTRGAALAGADATTLEVLNGYCEDAYGPTIALGLTNTTSTIRRLLGWDTNGTPNNGGQGSIRRTNAAIGLTVEDWACYIAGFPVLNTAAGSATFTNCSTVSRNLFGWNSGAPTLNYCVLQGGRSLDVLTGFTGDFNVYYFVGQAAPQFNMNGVTYGGLNMTLWQAGSGQDANSVFLKHADQVSGNGIAFWLGVSSGANTGPAAGDYRINPSARVYNGAGATLSGVFADGVTPITRAGAQTHYDFNLRSVVAGPPTRYPTLPATIAEMRTYLESPTGWNFYP